MRLYLTLANERAAKIYLVQANIKTQRDIGKLYHLFSVSIQSHIISTRVRLRTNALRFSNVSLLRRGVAE